MPHETPPQQTPENEPESFGALKNRAWETPREIIDGFVMEAMGETPESDERIVNGETNEVHKVTTGSGRELIVRIYHGEKGKFEKEKWALAECEKAGVRVPEMYAVKKIQVGDDVREICVESFIHGKSLEREAGLLAAEYSEDLKDILRQLGAELRKVHSVRTHGFGKLDAEGKGMFDSVEEMIAGDKFISRETIMAEFEDDPEVTATLLKAYEILKRDAGTYTSKEPCLIHNDMSPEHILIEDGEVSGLIDFEFACGADPMQELALWHMKHEKKYPLKYIVEGYCSDGTTIPDFEKRLNYWKIYRAMASLRYCLLHKKQKGIERAIGAIEDGCEVLG